MKYFITLFMIIFGTFGYAQSRNTFYVQKKNNDEIKKVYFIGERVNLLCCYSKDSVLKVKGLINEISEDKIKVNEKWIEVSSIHAIIKHGFFKTFIGSVGMAFGVGLILIKNKEPGGDGIFTKEEGIALTVFPIFLSSAAVLLIPIKYGHEKFIFKTHLAQKK